MLSDHDKLLEFWYSDEAKPHWFRRNAAFDDTLRQRFLATYRAAADGRLAVWEAAPRSALALVIALDQLPRNLFRDTPEAFATDAMALRVAGEAVDRGFDNDLEAAEQAFLYMPFMHSERLADQERALDLFRATGLKDQLPHAQQHRDIVLRFGRFPHRNRILGRDSTPEELAYLDSPGAFRG